MLSNNGEDKDTLDNKLGGAEEKPGRPSQVGHPTQLDQSHLRLNLVSTFESLTCGPKLNGTQM